MNRKILGRISLFILLVLTMIWGCKDKSEEFYLYSYPEYLYGSVGYVGTVDVLFDYYGNSEPKITLQSSNEAVVKVMDMTYEMVGAGTAYIYIFANGIQYATVSVVVDLPQVEVYPYYISNVVGSYGEITLYYNDNVYYDGFTLESTDEDIVKVDGTGYELVGEGEAKIKVYFNGKCCAEIEVCSDVYYTYDVTEIIMNEDEIEISKNQKYKVGYEVSPYYADELDVKWVSDNPQVAKVSVYGEITGVSAGTTTITCVSRAYQSVKDSIKVTVTEEEYISVEKVELSKTNMTLARGEIDTVSVTVTPDNATNKALSWELVGDSAVIVEYNEDTNEFTIKAVEIGNVEFRVWAEADRSKVVSCKIIVTEPAKAPSDQFFWGTWIDMSTGKEYEIEEEEVKINSESYSILAGSDDEILKVDILGNFEKQSDSVIIKDGTIPYFRKGGTDLSYQLRLVGFEDTITRAAVSSSVSGKQGLTAKGRSSKYTSFSSEAESNTDGYVELKAPVQGDVQNVSIETGNGYSITINDLKIENDGNFMGTVPIVEKDKYNLKVTGLIKNYEDGERYLYSGNEYEMDLTITNISTVKAQTSILRVYTEDDFISLSSSEDIENGVTISTLPQNGTKKVSLNIDVGEFPEAYVDTRIKVEISNAVTGQKWIDEVPLRIFQRKTTFTFKCMNPENNTNASLNGFIIYPDKNCKYFSVPSGSTKNVSVPLFRDTDKYILAFSGAIVTENLDDSTEVYYTVAIDSDTPRDFTYDKFGVDHKLEIIRYGEGNETEDSAFDVNNDFEAYLTEGDIDFYSVKLLSNTLETTPGTNDIIVFDDISLEYDEATLTLTADTGYDSYEWYVDNVKREETTNSIVLTESDLLEGTTEVAVLAKKDDSYRYKSIFIKK